MNNKPTGPAAAAREIVIYEEEHYGKIAPGYPGPDKSAEQQAIEAIILKHCPKDKPIGKLVDILRRLATWGRGDAVRETLLSIIEDAQAALAEYEELNK